VNLHDYLRRGAARDPKAIAVQEVSGASITYEQLELLSDRLRDRLVSCGVVEGDRVGIYLRKTIDTVGTVFGILKAGATYVPVDPTAPPTRNAYILDNCSVRTAVIEQRFEQGLRRELELLGNQTPLLVVAEAGGGAGLRGMLDAQDARGAAPRVATRSVPQSNLAYILYTSGSTGKPKGVMLSHENATSFVDWCVQVFEPRATDRFSSHAPFHFDLSILDIYTPLGAGATLVLIPEDLGKEPVGLAQAIADLKITVWYSAPSILAMIAQFGKLSTYDYSALRTVLFAGEVFPVVHLRSLTEQWPRPRYYNLYGPTETNVCTYYEVKLPVPSDRTDPYPIGKVCENLFGLVVGLDDQEVPRGSEGELCIAGPNVLVGYWSLPENTARAFLSHADRRYYHTGDIVIEEPNGDFRFVGRRDRMVKKRGFRVELGEIETCLYKHPKIKEAAVVALSDDSGVVVVAHLSAEGGGRVSLIELKKFCADHLPVYMIPDKFTFHEKLPKTSTDKIDYQTLKGLG